MMGSSRPSGSFEEEPGTISRGFCDALGATGSGQRLVAITSVSALRLPYEQSRPFQSIGVHFRPFVLKESPLIKNGSENL